MRRPLTLPTALATTLICLSLPARAPAQSVSCDEAIATATSAYALGQFAEVIDAFAPCDIADLPLADQGRAYELLVRSYVAESRFDEAQRAVGDLIRVRRDFAGDSPLLADMVAQARLRHVSSVSKFAEDWREAPATIAVVTAEEIARRGYRDVEAVLHDLPGFDISRGNGDLYSTLYQRGYRSNATDRTLVLVDGIEQNDLHSNIAYISRQYPLSNIDRIEVIYGPASTIYGPNAFSGVINVITKEPEAVIGTRGNHAAHVQGAAGAFDTVFGEGTYAGRSPDNTVSWSVTGRVFRSSEPDLSWDRSWQYGFPDAFDRVPYDRFLTLEGKTLDKFLCARPVVAGGAVDVLGHPDRCAAPTAAAADLMRGVAAGLAEIRDLNGDGILEIVPTGLAVGRANALDRSLWTGPLSGRTFSFADPTKEWFGTAKLKFSDFTIGVQAWRSTQSTTPWYRDLARGEGGIWAPRQTSIFFTYTRPVAGNFDVNVLVRYKNDQIDDESTIPLMATYASGYLSLVDLINGTAPAYTTFKVDQVSTQFRTEVTTVYQRSRWNAVAGADIRDGSSQAGYFLEADGPLFSFETDPTPQEIKATDVGLFAQASYTWRRLKAVAGLRYDGNEVRENERVRVRSPGSDAPELVRVDDFGKFLSPRVALVATMGRRNGVLTAVPGQLIVKGIFSRASQQPSNFQRFASEPFVRELASPFLGRERATNTEVSIGWEPDEGTRIEVGAYAVDYSDVLHTALKVDPCCRPYVTGQFQSIGAFDVSGVQATLSKRWGDVSGYANYTYTEALNSDQLRDAFGEELAVDGRAVERLPIGDVARHKFNVGGTARLWNRFDTSLRLNFVGRRPTGGATTSRLNNADVPPYAVAHGAVAYRHEPRGMTLQLGLNNLFNVRYWDPGVRSAEFLGFAGRIPQPGFSAYAQLLLDVNVARRRTE